MSWLKWKASIAQARYRITPWQMQQPRQQPATKDKWTSAEKSIVALDSVSGSAFEVAVKRQWRSRADILEFRCVGRHEGPKALISERTPRQTEGRKRKGKGGRAKQGQKQGGWKETTTWVKGNQECTAYQGHLGRRGQTARSKLLMHIKVNDSLPSRLTLHYCLWHVRIK